MGGYDTRYGFVFGPMRVERAIGDEAYGYVLTIKVGDRWFDFATSPAGRNVSIHEKRIRGDRVVSEREIQNEHRRVRAADKEGED